MNLVRHGGVEPEIVDDGANRESSDADEIARLRREIFRLEGELAQERQWRRNERQTYVVKHEQMVGNWRQAEGARQHLEDRVIKLELEIRGNPVLTSPKASTERKLADALEEIARLTRECAQLREGRR